MNERDFHLLETGRVLNKRYVIQDVLGEGGFGITYRALDEFFGRLVAIKEFFPHGIVVRNTSYSDAITVTNTEQKEMFARGREKFLDEARIIARFNSQEGIVNFTDFFEENNTVYIVMEYLEGITIRQYLNQYGRMPVDDVLQLLVPVVETLDEVHRQGLIHRDISPDNIMILNDGRVKLMDFGAARTYSEFGEKSLSVVLKPGYAPEEQYRTRGVQGPWTDIYGLSATIYKCITGITPEDSIQRLVEDHTKKPSECSCEIDPRTEAAIMKGLAVFARDRYQDLKSFCDDLYASYGEENAEAGAGLDQAAGQTLQVQAESEGASSQEAGPASRRGGMSPGSREGQFGSGGLPPESDRVQFGSGGLPPESDRVQFGSGGLPPESDRVQFGSGGLPPKSDGVQSASGGLPPESDKVQSWADWKPAQPNRARFRTDTRQPGQQVPEEKAKKAKKEIRKKPLIIASCALAALLLLAIVFKMSYDRRKVPDLVGLEYQEAVEKIKREKPALSLEKESEEYSDTVEKGVILSQSAAPGDHLKSGESLGVVVSKGKEIVSVPNIAGKDYSDAETILQEAKLTISRSSSQWSDDVKKNCIISQSPKQGEEVEAGSAIQVVVSDGIEQVTVPNILSLSVKEAKKKLKGAKLKMDTGKDREGGVILSQEPEDGTTVDKGKKIKVHTSDGPTPDTNATLRFAVNHSEGDYDTNKKELDTGKALYIHFKTENMWDEGGVRINNRILNSSGYNSEKEFQDGSGDDILLRQNYQYVTYWKEGLPAGDYVFEIVERKTGGMIGRCKFTVK